MKKILKFISIYFLITIGIKLLLKKVYLGELEIYINWIIGVLVFPFLLIGELFGNYQPNNLVLIIIFIINSYLIYVGFNKILEYRNKFRFLLILIYLIICKFYIGIYSHNEFAEEHIFVKYRPVWKSYFYSPIGMSDKSIDQLSVVKKEEMALFTEFVIEKGLSK